MIDKIKNELDESITILQTILADTTNLTKIYEIALIITKCFDNSGHVYICGNGGSAAEALHFSAEFLGRFKVERKSLPIFSLNADPAVITSIANDYGYEYIFSHQLTGILHKNDVLITLSTSGNSPNIFYALAEAKAIGCTSVCILGKQSGMCQNHPTISLNIPSTNVPRIQECQMILLHILCNLVENIIMQKQ